MFDSEDNHGKKDNHCTVYFSREEAYVGPLTKMSLLASLSSFKKHTFFDNYTKKLLLSPTIYLTLFPFLADQLPIKPTSKISLGVNC